MGSKVQLQDVEAKYLKVISEFAIDMLSLSGVEEILWHLAQNVVSQLGFDDVVVYLLDQERGLLVQKATFGAKNPTAHEILAPIELKIGEGVVGTVAKTKQPLIVADTRQFPNYIVDDAPRLSELAVPMLVDGEVIGVIDTEHPKKNFYTAQHEHILFALATITALKIHRANNLVSLQKRIEALEYTSKIQDTLFAIAEIIFETDSIKHFYSKLHQCISRLILADNFYVALMSDDGHFLHFPYHVDEYDEVPQDAQFAMSPGELGITGYVLLKNKPLLADENRLKQMVSDGDIVINGALPLAWLGVPFDSDSCRGIVVVQSYHGDYRYREEDLQLLVFVAKHICNAIARMQLKSRLTELALQDSLTKLPNRSLFIDRLGQALRTITQPEENAPLGFGLVFFDIDHFKAVNDAYGHQIGDELLKLVANRVRGALQAHDTLSRLGGDQFALLLEGISSPSECYDRVEALRQQMMEVHDLGGISISLSFSLGMVTCFSPHQSESSLMRQADQALLSAKLQGRAQMCQFDTEQESCDEEQLAEAFMEAIANGELYLEFQPLYRFKDGKLFGAEALLRWRHPTLGIISAKRLLPQLRHQEGLDSLDNYVAKQLLALLQDHHDAFPQGFRISQNIACDGRYLLDSLEGQGELGVKLASLLAIEVAEPSLATEMGEVSALIARAKRLGIQVSLDDVGASHASLHYLQRFRFDRLKIARSLISPMVMAYDNKVIFETIINLANTLNIETVAQGIETQEQYQTMQSLGCDYGQGQFMNPSMSAENLLLMLKESPFYR
ncbi:EAL domain-containing protein [Shewanella marisflavi]|uniref:EAL domain-containing protein n=1 Tax=Shewanella marisflavi TaxID=260364 RepID=UPI00200F3915|nr:EAL domain-containing protein [Shewanella marisflavi]MCL1041013.1 EAL domain-containing protein [Shewanella marisflavi]